MPWGRLRQRRRDKAPEGTGPSGAARHPGMPLEVSHGEMSDALRAGAAVPLGPRLPWVARYLDAWWVEYENGWLRVTDDHVAADLNDAAARLHEATVIADADEASYECGPSAMEGNAPPRNLRQSPKHRDVPK